MLRSKTRNQIGDTSVGRLQPPADLIELELQAQMNRGRKEKLALEVISRLQQQANGAHLNRNLPQDRSDDVQSPNTTQPVTKTAQRLRAALRMANNAATDGRPLLASEELPPPEASAHVEFLSNYPGDENDPNIFIPNADYNPRGRQNHNESAISGEKLEAATADIILSEYPMDCFPDHWYDRFPCCLEETTFWKRWKKIRYVFVKFRTWTVS